ncbi:MAG: divergent polysaccharide deacetylase family protein [Bdellovibrionales bacterium]|jgi:hypothetical protein
MKKKNKKRVMGLLWLLVLGALVTFWLLPVRVAAPRLHWRAPVHVVLPSLPKTPTLDEASHVLEEIRKQTLLFEEEHKPDEKEPPAVTEAPATQAPLPPVPAQPVPPLVPPLKGSPFIAIIIDDMGMTPALDARALRLPAPVTLSYLPYAPRVQEQADQAKARGHDILLHFPMEPLGKANPGPNALRVGQTPEEWAELIDKNLQSFSGYTGVNNHMGSRFTSDPKGMAVVAEALLQKGIFFVDSRTNPASIAEQTMRGAGVKTISRDIFLDDTQSLQAIRGELAHLERVARRQGVAVAIGHPHLVTIQALESWLPEAESRGFRLVPVRSLVR